ncbi:SDR family NAD(P)-dependent oxidoreductase [Mycobacterium sp. 94-17]|uniref:SDR family NAD(P)-dependent oxidoreductase n=1 Tax=Mycobacterium sp. 94-17 TaxID=2986147 RepID=UPI002D1F0572|nr:SDR family NAD(P)-dependent oxidoreductase [Mycobacterium sp. 94-17]MEB4211759.1 SDR family NAD(P)-dependent oxidoreductase [Mycobacterium sp. 94-17]
MTDLPAKYGRYALVTGASSGIGAEFAAQLAYAGFDLVVVARRRDRLEALAGKIQSRTGRHVFIAPADLAAPGAVDDLIRQTNGLDIGLVVAAAGVMVAGKFADNDFVAETATVQVNVLALMQLAQRFSAAMARRRRGALILLASAVGHAAVPYTANYAASKAYVSSLGRALHYELKPAGVDVLTLAPGPTDTEGFHETEGIDFTALPMPVMSTEAVVRFALKKLGRRALVIPGVMNRFTDRLGKYVIPSSWMTALFGRMLAKATAPAEPIPAAIRQDRAS